MSDLLGRYEILEEIGRGGFAVVHRARDTALGRLVALKELRPALLNDSDGVARFRREARTIARLDHPQIVTVYDVIEVTERLFILMRLVEGVSLDQLIASEGALSWSQALEIISAVATGLDFAHAQGILHRDLKPGNILIDPTRGPQLSDFGLAKLVGEASLTAAGGIVGTPHYLAPEVWEGQGATSQSDIYGLGCILFEMLTGEKVFPGEAPPTVMMAHFSPLAIPDRWPVGVPGGVSDVLRIALAREPGERYATAGELVQALIELTESAKGFDQAKPGLALYLLGSPRTELDGVALEVDRRKAIALLIYLALSPQRHRRDALATLLWPDYDQRSARGNLRRTLSVLNRAVGEGWLEIDRESVTLIRQPQLWIDVEEFRQLMAIGEGHDHPKDESCSDCLTALSRAAALYRDDFLTGFSLEDSPAFDDWQLFQAEDLRQALAEALAQLVRGYAAEADFKAALGYARRWLALDPLHEPVHRHLMQLYAWSGDRAAALRQYDACVRLFEEELGLPPDEETTSLYDQIRTGALEQPPKADRKDPPKLPAGSPVAQPPPPSRASSRHNLPAQTTPFIGREPELEALTRLIDEPALRLVTILGPGGMGKTRLALETATAQLEHFSHGVYFVALAPLESSDPMVGTIAEALKFSFYEGGTQAQQLLDYLREKSILLVLDNFEHVLDGADLISEILQGAPAVKILTTSRERLKLSGETVFALEGLGIPEDEPALDQSAIQLFIQTAGQLRPDFDPSPADLPAIGHICRLVQGMPLGIILAATWLELLSLEEIAAEISKSLDFLETEMRDLPERQRSMRAVFDHSWHLLSEAERAVFQQLTVFRGGFTREAAQNVTGASLRMLRSLVNKSLLQRERNGRYEIHELLRQYGAEQLAHTMPNHDVLRSRHSAYFCAELQAREADWKQGREVAAFAEMAADFENLRTAWRWGAACGQVTYLAQAMDSLGEFCVWEARYQEGEAIFAYATNMLARQRAESDQPTAAAVLVEIRVLVWQAEFNREYLGRKQRAVDLLAKAQALLEHSALTVHDVRRERAFLLIQLARVARDQGDQARDLALWQESLRLSMELDDHEWVAYKTGGLGWMALRAGNDDDAFHHFTASRALWKEQGNTLYLTNILAGLGTVALRRGDLAESEALLREGMAIVSHTHGKLDKLVNVHDLLGRTLLYSGKFTEAQAILDEGIEVYSTAVRVSAAVDLQQTLALVLAHMGHYTEAYLQANHVYAHWQKLQQLPRLATAAQVVGYIALAKKEYYEAEEWLDKSLNLFERLGERESQGLSLALLAVAQQALGQSIQAMRSLKQAHQFLLISHAFPSLIHLFPAAACLLAQQERVHTALGYYALASRYPLVANSSWFEDVYGRPIAAITATLSSEVVAAAQKRGQTRDLWQTAQELLEELSQPVVTKSPQPLDGPNNLPVQTTPFLGRDAELAELARFLAEPTVRLVTILGPGGMGKSRLALEAAGKQVAHFEHGAYFVRLAPLDAPESIVPAIAEAVNFSFYEGGTQAQQLRDYLREKQLLLIMDNFEHLLEGAEVVVDLLQTAPGLKILATSRARLNIQEEHRFPISGIDMPETVAAEAIGQSSAGQLFLDSARRVQADFALSDENSEPVAEICQLVRGMPLGIILAATWLELLTPTEIAAELVRSLDFLETEMRDLPERQRSMRAVFDHSWRLLSEPEREAFQQLSIFRGGFTREAAEAVCGASLRRLLGLVNKSLLQRAAAGRFEVHELLRQYGADKLAENPAQEATVRNRHCAFFCATLHQREADLKGPGQRAALTEIEADLDNVRVAWAWAVDHRKLAAVDQALEALYNFYWFRSSFQEGHDDFDRAVRCIQVENPDVPDSMRPDSNYIFMIISNICFNLSKL